MKYKINFITFSSDTSIPGHDEHTTQKSSNQKDGDCECKKNGNALNYPLIFIALLVGITIGIMICCLKKQIKRPVEKIAKRSLGIFHDLVHKNPSDRRTEEQSCIHLQLQQV